MELLVAMTVFLVVIGLSSGIFLQTLKTQRAITKMSENMNNITLALEQMAREIRTGFEFKGDGKLELEELEFRNGFGDYVTYTLVIPKNNGDKGAIGRCERPQEGVCNTDEDFDLITSPDVDIENLVFYIQNDLNRSPLVTVAAEMVIDREATITLQTSVSSRILD